MLGQEEDLIQAQGALIIPSKRNDFNLLQESKITQQQYQWKLVVSKSIFQDKEENEKTNSNLLFVLN